MSREGVMSLSAKRKSGGKSAASEFNAATH